MNRKSKIQLRDQEMLKERYGKHSYCRVTVNSISASQGK